MDQRPGLLEEFRKFAATALSAEELMQRISERLHAEMVRYNWVGFYLIDKNDPTFLALGPFVGSFTPLHRISLDQGLCGACASSGQTVVVQDVSKDMRYLEATHETKSEMVAPVVVKGKVAGELDVNSYFVNTFGAGDRKFVEDCAGVVAEFLAAHPES